jgi:1-acyl-sn-glycerol-3-phosphate acyltransferase
LLLQLIRPFIKLRIERLDLVPTTKSFLVVANHLHNADPILLELALPRSVHLMAKRELFANPALGWLVRRFGTFPVERGRPDRKAIRHAETLLANGIPVGMFPEGTRSKTGTLQSGFPGAGLVALRSDATILPAAIFGTEALPFNGVRPLRTPIQRRSKWRRHQVTIRFGTPFTVPTELAGARVSASDATKIVMGELARLLPAAYRGVYGNGSDEPAEEKVAPVDLTN